MNDTDHVKKERRWWHEVTLWNFLLVALIISAFVMSAVAIARQNGVATAMALATRGQIMSNSVRPGAKTGRTVSIASLMTREARVTTSFCERRVYYTLGGRVNDSLHRLTEPIDVFTQPPMLDYYYYPIAVTLDIDVGEEVGAALAAASKSMFRLSSEARYMSFTYNITTNYQHFSSIRLLEVEFAPYEQSVRKPREIVLCSNTAAVASKRCDRHADEKIITVHDTRWRAVVPQAPATQKAPSDADARARTAAPKPRTQSADSEEEIFDLIESGDASPSRIDAQKEDVQGLRLYNVVFYRAVPRDNLYLGHQMGAQGAQKLAEERVLSIELDYC